MAEEPKGKVWRPRVSDDRHRSAQDNLSYDFRQVGDIRAFRDMKEKAKKTMEDNRFE